eukprot:5617463-Amphidinium_carterae.2
MLCVRTGMTSSSWADITMASSDRAVRYHIVAHVLTRLLACALQDFIDYVAPVSLRHEHDDPAPPTKVIHVLVFASRLL